MADPLRRGAENPEFSAERALPNAEERPLPRPEEQIYVVERRSVVERRAAQTGSVLGRVAALVRNIQHSLRTGGEQRPTDKVRVMADRSRARAQELGEQAASRAQDFAYFLRQRSLELRDRAQERWAYLRQERPVHVAIGAGAVGFIVGVALRIRRAHNAE